MSNFPDRKCKKKKKSGKTLKNESKRKTETNFLRADFKVLLMPTGLLTLCNRPWLFQLTFSISRAYNNLRREKEKLFLMAANGQMV